MSQADGPQRVSPLVEFLLDPGHHPDHPQRVELEETHISWVFLTERYALKLKKPVRFEFLDYSTVDARRRACEDEVRLNRRLASDVYLGVLPVLRQRGGSLSIGGASGRVIDWLVHMCRLPRSRRLDELIRGGTLCAQDISALGRALTAFYSQSAPLTITPEAYRRAIERHIRANAEDLSGCGLGMPTGALRRIHTAQIRFLRVHGPLLDNRVCDGRIVDGHGDLRPEHVYLKGAPRVIDCIEFSEELRRVDVADELSFLAMECERLGAADVGRQVMECYSQASGDRPSAQILSFYKAYRACVRAKVSALRAGQLAATGQSPLRDEADRYLQLAARYADELGPPSIMVVGGLMGTGKSTLACALAAALEAELVSTDAIRRETLGASPRQATFGEGLYTAEARNHVYDTLLRRAERFAAAGLSVVLDGTFLKQALRDRVVDVARRTGANAAFVHCRCPDDVARTRIATRLANGDSLSEARPELRAMQKLEAELPEPGSSPDPCRLLIVDTTQSVAEQMAEIFEWLRGSNPQASVTSRHLASR